MATPVLPPSPLVPPTSTMVVDNALVSNIMESEKLAPVVEDASLVEVPVMEQALG